jgi:hypothetical protein
MLVSALAVVLLVLVAPVPSGASTTRTSELRRIERYRRTTWHWQRVMGVARTPTARREKRASNATYRHWVLRLWKKRAHRAVKRSRHVPHKRQWLCIHRGEGPWRANTGNGYYGGLQMDITFQRSYGSFLLRRKGTADHWTAYEQMWVAERAYRSGRGFHPWPNTARACGLI